MPPCNSLVEGNSHAPSFQKTIMRENFERDDGNLKLEVRWLKRWHVRVCGSKTWRALKFVNPALPNLKVAPNSPVRSPKTTIIKTDAKTLRVAYADPTTMSRWFGDEYTITSSVEYAKHCLKECRKRARKKSRSGNFWDQFHCYMHIQVYGARTIEQNWLI